MLKLYGVKVGDAHYNFKYQDVFSEFSLQSLTADRSEAEMAANWEHGVIEEYSVMGVANAKNS